MRNKKLKTIAAFIMGTVMATAAFGMTACGHEHTFSEEWSRDANNHWHVATCKHEDEIADLEAHKDGNNDGKCDACGYVLSVIGGETPGGETPGGETPGGETPGGETPGGETPSGGVTHDNTHNSWSAWVDDGDNGHHRNCTVTGCTKTETEAVHAYDNDQDTTCNKCPHTRTVDGGGTGGGDDDETETSTGYKSFVTAAGSNLVYKNSFGTAASVPYGKEAAVSDGTAKIYGTLTPKSPAPEVTDYVENTEVKIENGDLVIYDQEDGSYTVYGHVTLDEAVAGKVTVRIELKPSTNSTKWNYVVFCNASGNEILAVRTNNSGYVGYRTDPTSGDNATYTTSSTAVKADDLVTIQVTLDFDLYEVKVESALNGGNLVDVTDPAHKTFEAEDATSFGGLKFGTASAKRNLNVSNLAVKAEETAFADYKAAYDKKVADYNTAILAGCTIEAYKPAVSGKKAAYDAASEAAQDNAAIKTAYETYVSEALGLLKTYGKEIVQYTYPATNYTHDQTGYDAIISKLEEDLAASTTIDKALAAIGTANGRIESELRPDSYYNKKSVTVTVKAKYGESQDSWQTLGTFTIKSGEEISYDDILDKLTIPSGYELEGLYTDEGLSTGKVVDKYTAAEVSVDTNVNLYAKVNKITKYFVTFTGSANGCSATGGYDVAGWTYPSSKTGTVVTIEGNSYDKGIKLNADDHTFAFTLARDATVKIYFLSATTEADKIGLKLDGASSITPHTATATDKLYYIEVSLVQGSHSIVRAGGKEMDIFLMIIDEG